MSGRTAFILLACAAAAACVAFVEMPYAGGLAALLIFGSIWVAGRYLD